MVIKPWAASTLGCPCCGEPLEGLGARDPSVLRCENCGPFPVLSGVPILVPEPARWCATFYDAALSALAEHQLATPRAVETLRAFADAESNAEPGRFSDDWTTAEASGREPPPMQPGPAQAPLAALIASAEAHGPSRWLERRAPRGCVLEVGVGAGLTSRRLSKGRTLLVGDLSLRAVLVASRSARHVVPVVMDAHALPVRSRSLDAIVAENVVDLLEEPESFFLSASVALREQGRLLLSTPAPALDAPDGDETRLVTLARASGFEVEALADGLPWLRRNSSRFVEVWLAQAVSLQRGTPRRRSRRRQR